MSASPQLECPSSNLTTVTSPASNPYVLYSSISFAYQRLPSTMALTFATCLADCDNFRGNVACIRVSYRKDKKCYRNYMVASAAIGPNSSFISALRKGYKIDNPPAFNLESLVPDSSTTLEGEMTASGTRTVTATASSIITASVTSSEDSGLPSSSPIPVQSATTSIPNPSSDLLPGTEIGLGASCGIGFLILIILVTILVVRLKSRTMALASLKRQLNHRLDGPALESPGMNALYPYGGELDGRVHNGPELEGPTGQELATMYNRRKASYPESKT